MESKFQGLISFPEGYFLQRQLFNQRIKGEIEDTVLGLVHSPCITIGREGDRTALIGNVQLPVYFIERGGKATYHGRGQLVAYFIWEVKRYGIKKFLDLLEEILFYTLCRIGIPAQDIEKNLKGRGIWIAGKKVASIGISIKRWVSFHGLSLNLSKQIHPGFNMISPCGLSPAEICCLEHLGIEASAEETFALLVEVANELRDGGIKLPA